MINEVAVFEYLKERANGKGLTSLSIVFAEHGSYVSAFNRTGNCAIGGTIDEAVSKLPGIDHQASELIRCAQELEEQAAMRRSQAAKLLCGQELHDHLHPH